MYTFTLSFQSEEERKGDLKGFRVLLPADKVLPFIQSKNLSNISTNHAVSFAFGPTTRFSVLPQSYSEPDVCIMTIVWYQLKY